MTSYGQTQQQTHFKHSILYNATNMIKLYNIEDSTVSGMKCSIYRLAI